MSELEYFKRWAGLARLERAPQTDVASAALCRLRKVAAVPEIPATGIYIFASASVCAAAVCAVLGYDAWLMSFGDWYSWVQDFMCWRLI